MQAQFDSKANEWEAEKAKLMAEIADLKDEVSYVTEGMDEALSALDEERNRTSASKERLHRLETEGDVSWQLNLGEWTTVDKPMEVNSQTARTDTVRALRPVSVCNAATPTRQPS